MLSKIGVSGLCLGNVILSYIYITELDFDCGVISLVNKFSLSFSVEKIYLLAWVTFFLLIKSDICFGVFIVSFVQLNINARYGDIVKIHPSIMEKLFFKKIKGKSHEIIGVLFGAENKYVLKLLSLFIEEKGKAINLCIFLNNENISLCCFLFVLTRCLPPSFNIDNKDFHS